MEDIKITWDNIHCYSSVPIEYRFVDSADVIPGKEATANKVISSLDWYFKMHFPEDPIMPGVLLMETMQQTALLIVTTLPDIDEKVMYFQGCKNMRMFSSVRPGDTLQMHVILNDFRLGVANFHGEVMVKHPFEDKSTKACTMDFTMILPSKMLTISVENPVNTELTACSRGGARMFDYSNLSKVLADPIPYRFIDVVNVSDSSAYGYKNSSHQDWYYSFSKNMPAGFILEAIMQTGVPIVTQKEYINDSLMMFNGCKEMKIYGEVKPGDVLETKVLLNSFRNGVANYSGTAFLGKNTLCTADFTLIHPVELQKFSQSMKE